MGLRGGLAEIGGYGMDKPNPQGRKSKLTPERQGRIVQAILDGYTLESASRLAGISYSRLFGWLQLGADAKSPKLFWEFREAVRAAQKQAEETKIKANPRPLARARYERDGDPEALQNAFMLEVIRCRTEGRVPYDVAIEALEMALDEFRDKMADESISWAEDPVNAPVHGGHRGRSG